MTFTALTPGAWLTLFGSVALVVTLFYLLRLRRRRVEVPFGPLWEKALNEKQSSSLFKVLKRIFSLFLQLLFVALIVTALADPRWTGESGVEFRPAPKASASHTLLVVDRSASMSATDVPGGRFAAAIQAARKVISGIRPGEEIMLATVGRDFSVVSEWTHDKKQLKNLLNEVQVEDGGTSVDAMQRFCTNAFQALSNPRLVFITDGAFKEPNSDAMKDIDYKVVDVGSKVAPSNVAVLDFSVRPHLGNALKYALYYRLKNLGDRPVKLSAYLYSDPVEKAQTRADFVRLAPAMAPMIHHLEAGEEKVVEQASIELEGSRAALIIRSDKLGEADLFAADDAAFAVVPKRRKVRVQLVGPTNFFLEAALQTRSHVEVSSRTESEFKTLKGFDLTVFNGVAPRVEETGNRIYVAASGPGLPFKVKGRTRGGTIRVPQLRRNDSLMRFVRFKGLKRTDMQRIKKGKNDAVMARGPQGVPAILAHSDADERWLAVAFDPIATEWVGHYSFSVFFVNAINWFFAEEAKLLHPWSLAESWSVTIPWRGVSTVKVTTPSGKIVTPLVDGGGTLAFSGTEEGIYTIEGPGSESVPMYVAAALNSRQESRLTSLNKRPEWAPPTADELNEFSLKGASIWHYLVLLALLLIGLEWLSYHRRWTV